MQKRRGYYRGGEGEGKEDGEEGESRIVMLPEKYQYLIILKMI